MLESINSDLEKNYSELEKILKPDKKLENKINLQNKIIFYILIFLIIFFLIFFLLFYFKKLII